MPGKYDGYVTPVPGGFEAAAGGVVVGVFDTVEVALMQARRPLLAGTPVWLVGEDGEATEAAN